MPYSPKRPCRYPGCPGFCEPGQVYCKTHLEFSSDRIRGGADARGYDSRWRAARKLYLHRHPLCAVCRAEGRLTPATVVDHIIPHRGDKDLFWDQNNWQPLCKACHDKKTGHGL
jgi:5-methylcytosine-specific restriction protein A